MSTDTLLCMPGVGLSSNTVGNTLSESQPFSRTGENPMSGCDGGVVELPIVLNSI